MSAATIGVVGTVVGAALLAASAVALIAEAWWLSRPAPRIHVRTRRHK